MHALPSMDCSSCQESALVWALHGLPLLSGRHHLLWCGVLHELQCGYLLHHGPSQLQGNLCLCAWRTSFPSSFSHFGVYNAVSLVFFSLFTLTAAVQHFLPFLNYIPRTSPGLAEEPSGGAQLCSAVSPAQGSPRPPSQAPPLQTSYPLSTKTWTFKPNTHF